MNWQQITLVVDANLVEPASTLFETFLAQAITTQSANDSEYYEVAFPGTPDWQHVHLTALFDEAVDCQPIIDFVLAQLQPHSDHEIPVSLTHLRDQDWQRVWRESYQPIQVGEQLWVCPSWCEPTDPSARNIYLDPGLAFGTGTHPTTAMCLQWLSQQDLSQQTVLDYGSGSGILAIAALLANAERVDALDIDPLAVEACQQNAQRNGQSTQMHCCLPNQLGQGKYDLVIANILAGVIIELRDTLLLHCGTQSQILLTGILDQQADQVIAAFSHEFSFTQQQQDSWCLLVGSRKNHD